MQHWYDIIGEATFPDAVKDRLIHDTHPIELQGESLRKKWNQSKYLKWTDRRLIFVQLSEKVKDCLNSGIKTEWSGAPAEGGKFISALTDQFIRRLKGGHKK